MTPTPSIDLLRAWLTAKETDPIREWIVETHPRGVADLLRELDDAEIWDVLRFVSPQEAAQVFCHLPLHRQVELTQLGDLEVVTPIVQEMSADDRADLVKMLDDEQQRALLGGMPESQRHETQRLARYDEGTVGSVMSTDFAAMTSQLTAAEALDLIRLEAPRKETIYSIYVMDDESRLIGVVSLRDLIMAPPNRRVADLMEDEVISVRADEPRTVAAEKVKAYDLLALPVIDHQRHLIGIVTVDDVLDVEEEEATTDFHRMAPIGLMKTSLKDAGLAILLRARLPWLMLLVFMNIFSGAGIAYFEETIDAVVALVFFLPLLIDSGGNAGSQAATLMVRALAVGDVRLRDWLRLVGKEFLVSFCLGVSMAVAVMLIAYVRAPDVLVPVALTMVCTVMFGSLVGTCLPFILTRLKMDPATASAPLITSIADIGGVLIYFSIATWWLGPAIHAASAGGA